MPNTGHTRPNTRVVDQFARQRRQERGRHDVAEAERAIARISERHVCSAGAGAAGPALAAAPVVAASRGRECADRGRQHAERQPRPASARRVPGHQPEHTGCGDAHARRRRTPSPTSRCAGASRAAAMPTTRRPPTPGTRHAGAEAQHRAQAKPSRNHRDGEHSRCRQGSNAPQRRWGGRAAQPARRPGSPGSWPGEPAPCMSASAVALHQRQQRREREAADAHRRRQGARRDGADGGDGQRGEAGVDIEGSHAAEYGLSRLFGQMNNSALLFSI